MPKTFLVASDVDRARRALDAGHLNNDHPVVASRDAVKQADKQLPGSGKSQAPKSRGTPSAGPSGGIGSGSSAGSGSGATDPIGGLVKNSPLVKIPAPGDKSTNGSNSTGGGSGAGSGAGGSVGNLGAGLGDAVETLLPDVPGLPKLP